MRNDSNVDTITISDTIVQHTISDEMSNDTVGGDIISITDLMGELLQVHCSLNNKETDYFNNTKLTNNILNTTNHLISSTFGWEEISSSSLRYETSSDLLSITDSVAYLLFQQSHIPRTIGRPNLMNSVSYNFKASRLNVNSIFWKDKSNRPSNPFCYSFDQTSICLPETAYDNVLDEDEIIEVSAQYEIDPNLFPTTLLSETYAKGKDVDQGLVKETNIILLANLISLSINNGSTVVDISAIHPISITFNHEATEVSLTAISNNNRR